MKIFKRIINTFGLIAALVIGGVIALYGAHVFSNPFDSVSQNRNTQIIHSLEREQQVVLLSLGVQEIENASETKTFKNINIPGTTRTYNVQFSFDAKIGIEGEDVTVEDLGDNRYRVKIPDFIFIGHENLNVHVIHEENGVLSWVTPEIDKAEMFQSVLNDELQSEYIQKHSEILREQAANFYRGIVESIDPDASLEFNYSN